MVRNHEGQGTLQQLDIHLEDLKNFFKYAINLFRDELESLPFPLIDQLLGILKGRSQDEAYVYLFNTWCSSQCQDGMPRLWLYWECAPGTRIPDFIRLCWKTMAVHCAKDFWVTIVTPETVVDYLPNIDKCYKKLEKIAHRTDFIRFNLLYEHGGLWLDSDMIVLRSLRQVMEDIKEVGFAAMGYCPDSQGGAPFPIISFLAATSGNKVAGAMVDQMRRRIRDILENEKRQPEWDEIGGFELRSLIEPLEKKCVFYNAMEYFTFFPFWQRDIPLYRKISMEKLYGRLYPAQFCQSLTNSRDDRSPLLTEEIILNDNTLLSNLYKISFTDINIPNLPSISTRIKMVFKQKKIVFRKYIKIGISTLYAYSKAALSLQAWKHFFKRRYKKYVAKNGEASTEARDPKNIFTSYFKENTWNSDESFSGEGSTLNATKIVRSHLPEILRKYEVKSLLDAPCGDFNWMKHVDVGETVYTGGDIVADIVKINQKRFGSSTHRFVELDIVNDPLPEADMMLCRDCLIHLSFEDINRFLANLHASSIKYLLVNTYPERTKNVDIQTGQFRPVNLCLLPFSFPDPIWMIREGCGEDSSENEKLYQDKSIALWPVLDLPKKLAKPDLQEN